MNKHVGIILVVALFCAMPACGTTYYPVHGWCEDGGEFAVVQGLLAVNPMQASHPGCQVAVFETGTTTPASLFSNATGTPLTNPFTANSTNGQWIFFIAGGDSVDITMTLGNPAFAAPVTYTDVIAEGVATCIACVTTFNGRAGAVVPANGDYSVGQVTGAAPIASPTFTGLATAPNVNAVNGIEFNGSFGSAGQVPVSSGGGTFWGSGTGTAGTQLLEANISVVTVNANTVSPQTLHTYAFAPGMLNSLKKTFHFKSMAQATAATNNSWGSYGVELNSLSLIVPPFPFAITGTSGPINLMLDGYCTVTATGATGTLLCAITDFGPVTVFSSTSSFGQTFNVDLTSTVTLKEVITYNPGSTSNTATSSSFPVWLDN